MVRRRSGWTRWWWGVSVLGGVALVAACADDPAPGVGDGDAGAVSAIGGAGGATAGGTAGMSFGASGGTLSGSDGTPDTTAPVFGGVTAVMATGDTSALVSWAPATDDVNSSSVIAYAVYLAENGAELDLAGEPFLVTPAGASSALLSGLEPGASYSVVVRALDDAGNQDDNSVAGEVTLPDYTAPLFSGVGAVEAASPTSLRIRWTAARDSAGSPVTYRVYVYEETGNPGEPVTTTDAGATEALIDGLDDGLSYHVRVVAVDLWGNADPNQVVRTATTPDATPPTFDGATRADAGGTAVRLRWDGAVDNITAEADLRYAIFEATASGAHNFDAPVATVPGASTEVTLTDRDPDTTFYYVVRAVDEAGLDDGNRVEVSATTAASVDTEPPVFGGATSADGTGSTVVTLSWAAATDALSDDDGIQYDVYLASASGFQDFLAPPRLTSTPGATTVAVTGLTPSTDYYFVVRARDVVGNVDTNAVEVTATTKADDTPPLFTGISALTSLGPTELRAEWPAAVDDTTPDADVEYRVFVASSPGALDFATPTATLSGATSIVLDELTPATSYTVAVRAVDLSGNVDPLSTSLSTATDPDTTAPELAAAPTVQATSATSLMVSWGPATDDVVEPATIQYRVYVSTTSGSFTAPVTTTAGNVTSYEITGLDPETSYHVAVNPLDGYGNESGQFREGSADTLPDTTAPTFAGVARFSSVTFMGLTVEWDSATDDATESGAMRYQVCWSTSPSECVDSFTAKATKTGGQLSHSLSGLTPGVRYYAVVKAVDEAGLTSGGATQLSVLTTSDTTPPVFAGLQSVTSPNATTLDLSWNAASDAVYTDPSVLVYDIYEATTDGGQSFAAPTYTTAAGATTFQVTGLTPATDYWYVVRARDPSNVSTTDTADVKGTTRDDTTAPVFAGSGPSVSSVGVVTLGLTWPAATDDSNAVADLDYQLCWTTTSGGCSGAGFAAMATTAKGDGSATISGLTPATDYFVVVAPRDSYGNVNTSVVQVAATTLADTAPPTLVGGATYPGADSVEVVDDATLRVIFPQAEDVSTATAAIVYRACMTQVPGACDGDPAGWASNGNVLGTQTQSGVTSATGSFTFGSLDADESYTFVVKAEDAYGNATVSDQERSGTTAFDVTAPVGFTGVDTATPLADGSSVTLAWDGTSVSDPGGTADGDMRYRIYVDGSLLATTAAGASSYTVSGLQPTTSYSFEARAYDQGNNEGASTTPVNATTQADGEAPATVGQATMTLVTATTARASWTETTDNVTAAGALYYDVCLGTTSTACTASVASFNGNTVATVQGASFADIPLPGPELGLYVLVRARDAAGNHSADATQVAFTSAADTTAPDGAAVTGVAQNSASPETALDVTFSTATDDVTAKASIVYTVCWSATNGGSCLATQDESGFSGGTGTSTITGLSPGTTYWVRVTATDTATSPNSATSASVSGTTDTDDAPGWSGASVSGTPGFRGGIVFAETYYDGIGHENNGSQPAYSTAVGTTTINDNWAGASPVSGLAGSTWSARWEGWIFPATTASSTSVTLSGNYDDGYSLEVGGTTLYSEPSPGVFADSAATSFNAGTARPFNLELYQNAGGSRASLQWAWSGQSTEVIPIASPASPRLNVSWSGAIDDVTATGGISYDLCWSPASSDTCGASFSAMANVGAGVTSTQISSSISRGASATTYNVYVRPKDANLTPGPAEMVAITLPGDQGAPRGGLVSEITSADVNGSGRIQYSVKLTQAVDDVTATGDIRYRMKLCTNQSSCEAAWTTYNNSVVGTLSGTATATNDDATSAPVSKRYIAVRPEDAAGNILGGTTLAIADDGAPSNPTSVTASLGYSSGGRVTAQWSSTTDGLFPADTLYYDVEYCRLATSQTSSSGCSWATLASNVKGTGTLSQTVSVASSDGSFWVRVKAKDPVGNESSWVTSSRVVTSGPSAPGTISVSASFNNTSKSSEFDVSWSSVSGGAFGTSIVYDVQVNGSNIATDISGTSTSQSGYTTYQDYTVRVRAQDQLGNTSGWTSTTVYGYWAIIDPFFEACNSCHSSNGYPYLLDSGGNFVSGVGWSAYDLPGTTTINENTVRNQRAQEFGLDLIEPNNTGASWLYVKIASATPPVGANMITYSGIGSGDQVTAIAAWINDNAPRPAP